ncbi:MAG: LamG domain-containing protein [Phycisphaerae bacterium]|nr:LamG domain-containing protein [Phycisphaerae bacterium]
MTTPRTRTTCFTMSAVAALGLVLATPENAVADLNDGLVGYWTFDEGSGGVVHDLSGNGNDGTIVGAGWVEGVSGTALEFDGQNDFVEVPDDASLDITGDISLAAWIYAHSMPGAHPVFSKGTWGSNYAYYTAIGGSYGNRADFQLHSAGTETLWLDSEQILQVGRWYHVVAVRAGNTATIYVNGVFGGDSPCFEGAIRLNDLPLYFGSHYDGGILFHGVLDELRLYDRALGEDEIQQLGWAAFPDQQEENTEGDQSDVSGTSSDPVNTATGNFAHQETDLSIPSRGSPLIFTRYYNSKAAAPGRKVAKSKQAPPNRKTATSQPANTKHGKRSSAEAQKHDQSPAGKDQDHMAGSSQPQPGTKEEGK